MSESEPSVSRNSLCPCGSGRKFKHCHGSFSQSSTAVADGAEAESLPKLATILRTLTLRNARHLGLLPAPNESFFRYVTLDNFNDGSSKCRKLFEMTLLNDKIPLVTATQLNDPFDVNPVFVNDLPEQDILDWLKGADVPVDVNGKREKFDPDRHRVQKHTGFLTHSEVSQKTIAIVTNALTSNLRENFGLASFSKTITSQLMWAHYSKSYRGIAYHFVVSGEPTSITSKLRKVSYVNQRPLVPLSSVLHFLSPTSSFEEIATEKMDFLDNIFLFKATDWAHEQEYRIINMGKEPAHFSSKELVSIVVGPNFPSEWVSILHDTNRKRKQPLKLFRAHLSPSNYSIEVDWEHAIEPA